MLEVATSPYPALGVILNSLVLLLDKKKSKSAACTLPLSHHISNLIDFLLYINTIITHKTIINAIAADITIPTDTITDT